MKKFLLLCSLVVGLVSALQAKTIDEDVFRQLEEVLPTPNVYRNGAGAPAHQYWQQRANYQIKVRLDEEKRSISGQEWIEYENHSPDSLSYLWLQLDYNNLSANSDGFRASTAPNMESFSYKSLNRLLVLEEYDGSVKIKSVTGENGETLNYRVTNTQMRINLDKNLRPGEKVKFHIEWSYDINDAKIVRARAGYEHFEEDGNDIFEIAHWYPRMVAYSDVQGWHNKPFLGSGEFTLEMGDFDVEITVPADHIVTATGEIENVDSVLSKAQKNRLAKAGVADKPVWVVTPDEALENQKKKTSKEKTWKFSAKNVRDFAFASSRKFIWDAMGHKQADGSTVMAMSFYPNEAEPLWSHYSTHAIIHTLEVYSRYTFLYPYPVAISVNGPVGGMEYPMISFNGPRPEKDQTYFGEVGENSPWKHSKYALISVIIHEVGHNYFPMIVNSDERQWTWMDEGLNTFLQFIAEQEWEEDYPSRRGEPKNIVEYMLSENQVPIMTNSESLLQFGNNAYAKPATAMNILRETILGREEFDHAFREYSQRWMFKRPMPADLFRMMEDASGVDLDWFFRGWFYTTQHVDIALNAIHELEMDTRDPAIDKERDRRDEKEEPTTVSETRFKDAEKRMDNYPELSDFYNDYDEHAVTEKDKKDFEKLIEGLEDNEKEMLKVERRFYVLDFENKGGLVMPIILKITFADASHEMLTLPAEVWRRNPQKVSKLLMRKKQIVSVVVDPYLQTADTDIENNFWPARMIKSRFQLYKDDKKDSPMKQALKKDEDEDQEEE